MAGVLAGVLAITNAEQLLTTIGINLYVGFGDDRAAAPRSLENATSRLWPAGINA